MSTRKAKPVKQQFWGERLKEPPEMRNVAYCAGRDVAPRPMADQALIPYDTWQNRAHVVMLTKQGVIDPRDAAQILASVREFAKLAEEGKLQLDPRKEDVHTNIEHFVAEKIGEKSGRMHTGRSRNDQTTTVVRLYVRERVLRFAQELLGLVAVLQRRALEFVDIPIAGFTHYQPASVTTVGHWLASYAQFLLRDVERLLASYDRLNISPLGAAASFGTSWPIDRKLTAKLMGFDAVQANSLDCVTNRWEMEADAASAVSFVMTHLSIVAQDLVVLSLPQINIIRIADRYVTGSSIMPQKRNPDFAEVTRSKATVVQNLANSLFGAARGALSGYNRDSQWTKYMVMDVFDEAFDAPAIFAGVFDTLEVDRDRATQSASQHFIDAVDVADVLAQEAGLPFRTTYGIVSNAVRLSEDKGSIDLEIVRKLAREAGAKNVQLAIGSPAQIAARKRHIGGPAASAVLADLKEQARKVAKLTRAFEDRSTQLDRAKTELEAAEKKL